MSLKSMIFGGFALLGVAAVVVPAMVSPAEAKTRVHVGVGLGYDPFWDDCENPGLIDYCRYGYYPGTYHRRVWPGYYNSYHRPYYRDPYFRFESRNSCSAAALTIRNSGYRNVRALDCRGRYFKYQASRRGKIYTFNVDTRTGRISRAR